MAFYRLQVFDAETEKPVSFAQILFLPGRQGFVADSLGKLSLSSLPLHAEKVVIGALGYARDTLLWNGKRKIEIRLKPDFKRLDEIVVSGNLREMNRLESTSLIEVYTPTLFKKTWNPSLLESVNMVNGVQPQLNCNVCNTGDIHINGLEGPYTLVLIDGMPIVSSLSSVYGLSGIPQSMIKRIEVVKGPASTLYGSEAMGGLINVITQDPLAAPKARIDISGTSIGEWNGDFSVKWKNKKVQSFLGVNAFMYQLAKDINQDNFTDLALSKRVSVFWKTDVQRPENRKTSFAFRLYNEDRWGGQMNWTPRFRGSKEVYGESIQTQRFEVLGTHEFSPSISINMATNGHIQHSWYGTTPYNARQWTSFAQMIWTKKTGKWSWLGGIPIKYTYYDDNSVATEAMNGAKNQPFETFLPGIFLQSEVDGKQGFSMLSGIRYDHHPVHGSIITPRLAFKKTYNDRQTLRLSAGTGYRVVNLFTEDHAALSGSRKVVIVDNLLPEKSWNITLNSNRYYSFGRGFFYLDFGLFYTRFSNQIVGDFVSDPTQIRFDNLHGVGISRGANASLDLKMESGFSALLGITFMQVFRDLNQDDGSRKREIQMFAPAFSGTYSLAYRKPGSSWSFDLTGRINGPMRLPVLPNDFRPEHSPLFHLANIQVSRRFPGGWECFSGIKNLFNFIPKNPIMRPFDPFNQRTQLDNPNGYTFDTAYNYAPMQGLTGYAGFRWTLQ